MDVVDPGPLRGGGELATMRNFEASRLIRSGGTPLAAIRACVRALAMTCCLPLMGCLVTDEIDYRQEEPYPPSIETPPGVDHPLSEVIILDGTSDGNPNIFLEQTELEVDVRDPNINQVLFYKIFVDFERAAIGPAVEWPEQKELKERREILVDNEHFQAPGCHRLELFVTGGFSGLSPRGTEEDEDFATAVWWLYTVTPESPETFDPAECPGQR